MAFVGAVLALVLWLFCGSYIAAEAVYPVENGANWFSRHVGSRIKSLFAGSSAFSENKRLRELYIAARYGDPKAVTSEQVGEAKHCLGVIEAEKARVAE